MTRSAKPLVLNGKAIDLSPRPVASAVLLMHFLDRNPGEVMDYDEISKRVNLKHTALTRFVSEPGAAGYTTKSSAIGGKLKRYYGCPAAIAEFKRLLAEQER